MKRKEDLLLCTWTVYPLCMIMMGAIERRRLLNPNEAGDRKCYLTNQLADNAQQQGGGTGAKTKTIA